MKKIMIGLIAAFFFIGIYFYVTGQRASVLEKELATDIFHENSTKALRRYSSSGYDARVS